MAGQQLLAIFDVIDDLVRRGDRNARVFVETLATISRGHAQDPRDLQIEEDFRILIDTLARDAEYDERDEFVASFRLLLSGSILKAVRGDHDAVLRGRAMAADLVSRHGVTSPARLPTPAHPVAEGSWETVDLDLDSYTHR